MGTDILFRVEERTEHGWVPADTGRHWYSTRWPVLFGLLRDYYPARGLPSDVSGEVREDARASLCEHRPQTWFGDVEEPDPAVADASCACLSGWGHTYLVAAELVAHDWSHVDTEPERPGPQWATVGADFLAVILRMACLAGADLSRVRCVYWFY